MPADIGRAPPGSLDFLRTFRDGRELMAASDSALMPERGLAA